MCGITFCVTSALCCAGAACCKCLCLPAKLAGVAAKNYSKVGYVFFQISMIVLAVAGYYMWVWLADSSFADFAGFGCKDNGGSCAAASTIIRMSWALAIFHFFILLITLARNKCAAAIHDGFWSLKFLLVFGIFIASLWIPNDPVMNGYMVFAKWVSSFFLTYQAILILIMAYVINERLVDNMNAEGGSATSCSGIILLLIFFCFFAGDITWIVFQYMRFTGDGCGRNTTFITMTTIIGVLIHILVLFTTRPDASVLTSSIVLSYFLYLQWIAMSSAPDPDCNPFAANHAGNATFEIITGIFFNFFALLTIAGSTSKDSDKTLTNDLGVGLMENEDNANVAQEDMESGQGSEEAMVFPISTATILFQGLMILSSVYFAMLMTNWGDPFVLTDQEAFFTANYQSYWINIAAMWASQAIYIFSLTAPFCIEREYGTTQ